VVSDEIYDAFNYVGGHQSMCRHYDNTLLVGGFGKTYGIPGWRLGFAAGPKELLEKMTMFQQFSFVCPHVPSQIAAITMLETDMSAAIADYQKKRDMVYEGLKDLYEINRPEGAFYFFPKCPKRDKDDEAFLMRCIKESLLIIPGRAFSPKHTHFRISFAAEDEALRKGIDILRKLAE
ncbi:MAG: pyridoxal phosphate-dependent aminotransferase, partial [Planctomycetota bacterium]